MNARVRQRLRVSGVVQGVGFRPFVFMLANRHRLSGVVGNDSSGVFIEVEGTSEAVAAFRTALINEPPPLAHIERVEAIDLPLRGDDDETRFVIVESERQPGALTLISPDLAVCDDCLRELFDPNDRRYRYPFINCTHCGPRFTITKDTPYDRLLTTMAAFEMCADCRREYGDPRDRRFHAQPIACAKCGPRVWLEMDDVRAGGNDAIIAVQRALREGLIVATKGIGGFHLACDATNEDAVRRLRERKGRGDKPFGLMVRDLDLVREIAEVSDGEARLLTSRQRPMVLLECLPTSSSGETMGDRELSSLIAPGSAIIGVMLPYSPLHHLLLDGMPPLVMTSGNLSDEPIVKDNDDARAKLSGIADALLLHDRDIHVWCDDSVVRVFDGHELPIRRSRGYAPFPVKLPHLTLPILAVGGELKATFCLTRDDYAFMSQHIGDMENLETLEAFERALAHFIGLFRAEPRIVACDMHPRYLSSYFARTYSEQRSLPVVQVQHHHAHVASVMAEHGLDGARPVIGFSFDGTGYGDDGAIWGGEVLIADYAGYQRVAHLSYTPLPGGDAVIKRPYRMALAHLWAAGMAWDEVLPSVAACPAQERVILAQQLARNLNCAPTSSMGRLFDAVASLAGLRQGVTYEGQAALEFEALADEHADGDYHFALSNTQPMVIEPRPMLMQLTEDVCAGVSVGTISMRFHRGLAEVMEHVAVRLREQFELNTVAMSGGVFQNMLLLRLACERLRAHGFVVLVHERVPPNDGGLALGQAAIAGRMFPLP